MNNHHNLVSVLMPVWKTNPLHLSLSMKSILDQRFTDLELLVLYEKSLDKTSAEIENIFEENSDDHRLKIIQTTHKGLANSLNEGLTNSKGQFIARMDSDDISENNRIEEQLNYLEETRADLVGSWAISISDKGEEIGTIKPPLTHSEIRKKIMFHNPFLHPSIFFRKNVTERLGGYNPAFNGAEDYDLNFRIIAAGYKVSNIPKLLIRLRETENSIMRGKDWEHKRWIYFKVKENAVRHLGYTSPRDLFYFFITPLTFLVSPKSAFFLKTRIGYNKKLNLI